MNRHLSTLHSPAIPPAEIAERKADLDRAYNFLLGRDLPDDWMMRDAIRQAQADLTVGFITKRTAFAEAVAAKLLKEAKS